MGPTVGSCGCRTEPASGTKLVKDIHRGNTGSCPSRLTASGGRLFFVAEDGVHGFQLWKSDGTRAGTGLVKGTSSNDSYYPAGLTNVAGRLFFVTSDRAHGPELWVSDGTSAGTRLVKDIEPGGRNGSLDFRDDTPPSLAAVGHTLFFTPKAPAHGEELWRSDGTSAGTRLGSASGRWRTRRCCRRGLSPWR